MELHSIRDNFVSIKTLIWYFNFISLKVLRKLEKLNIPSQYGGSIPFVKISDGDEAAEYGLDQEADFPKIILFENGIPEVYDGGMELYIILIFTCCIFA